MMCLLELFYTFFKIGLFTFGGGYAMLPLIQAEVVAHGWLTVEGLVDFVAVSESTPGPFAINISTYVGAETVGILGALAATMGVVLPSFLVILIVAKFYVKFKNSRAVSGVMYGLRSAVVGLMACALWGMLPTVFFHSGEISWRAMLRPEFLCTAGIFTAAVVAALKKVSPILIIVCSAALGIVCGLLFL
ncbi:MAG: chromate transporter [Faecousia sp.]